jgi:hypothetical protein
MAPCREKKLRPCTWGSEALNSERPAGNKMHSGKGPLRVLRTKHPQSGRHPVGPSCAALLRQHDVVNPIQLHHTHLKRGRLGKAAGRDFRRIDGTEENERHFREVDLVRYWTTCPGLFECRATPNISSIPCLKNCPFNEQRSHNMVEQERTEANKSTWASAQTTVH